MVSKSCGWPPPFFGFCSLGAVLSLIYVFSVLLYSWFMHTGPVEGVSAVAALSPSVLAVPGIATSAFICQVSFFECAMDRERESVCVCVCVCERGGQPLFLFHVLLIKGVASTCDGCMAINDRVTAYGGQLDGS